MQPPTQEEIGVGNTLGKYYFDDVGQFNEAKQIKIESESVLSEVNDLPSLLSDGHVSKVTIVVGVQAGIAKFHEHDDVGNTIRLFMAIIELPRFKSHILISFSLPTAFSKTR